MLSLLSPFSFSLLLFILKIITSGLGEDKCVQKQGQCRKAQVMHGERVQSKLSSLSWLCQVPFSWRLTLGCLLTHRVLTTHMLFCCHCFEKSLLYFGLFFFPPCWWIQIYLSAVCEFQPITVKLHYHTDCFSEHTSTSICSDQQLFLPK